MKRFIRKYKTAKKTYEIGDLVDIKDEKVLESLIANGTVKEFKEGKTPLEKRIEELEEENKALKSEKNTLEVDGVIVIPLSYKELSEMTHDELDKVDENLEIKTDGKKEERVSEIWTKLSEGYEAGSDEEL